jgi:hypothetical protein
MGHLALHHSQHAEPLNLASLGSQKTFIAREVDADKFANMLIKSGEEFELTAGLSVLRKILNHGLRSDPKFAHTYPTLGIRIQHIEEAVK